MNCDVCIEEELNGMLFVWTALKIVHSDISNIRQYTVRVRMATYIDLSSPEELYMDLINQVASIKKKKSIDFNPAEYQRMLGEQRAAEFLSKLITSESDLLFKETDKVVHRLETEAVNIIAQKIRDVLTSNANEKSQLKIKLLVNLFNSFPPKSPQRFEVFYSLLKLASESGNIEFIKSQLSNLETLMEDWSATTEQKRKIYKLLSTIFKEKNSMTSHSYLVKYLQTFTKNDAEEAQEESVRACIESISLQELYQSDYLLDLEAIRFLETSSNQQHKLTYELMKIFATEQLDTFMAFQQRNPSFLAAIGLKSEDSLQKIRLLSLATLTSEDSKVPYATISKSLQIDENDVETWVINAIAGELIDAKLDQLNRVVHVNTSTQRVFNKAQWAQLGLRVGAWRSSVKNLLQVIDNAKNTQIKPFYWQSR
ncbi:proteasome component region PCI domain-containing protein [Cavenderia fasciculata]|uniref:Eukaryotic translation initiation factor 3 subunit M n=1 Tax=Cavenderia fasciculata TaxID=261658 RepID=F4PMA0_CACFS|nr:proteasome component region PCI domain-containing protein [Cavenderia fasciculata]EGG23600.1 proteasome component region PCI domain-containing protein [Cavenderia fasciculata]|eukprot:XP_004361451.1 proteasome component region PCI domain-containing protein [Cavenderia fasciculata]